MIKKDPTKKSQPTPKPPSIDLTGLKHQIEREMPTDTEVPLAAPQRTPDLSENALLQDLITKLKVAEKTYGLADRTADVTESSAKRWSELGLPDSLLAAIAKMGYEYPSPVQYRVIRAYGERSMIVRAKNGTGKTASYLIPLIASIIKEDADNCEVGINTTGINKNKNNDGVLNTGINDSDTTGTTNSDNNKNVNIKNGNNDIKKNKSDIKKDNNDINNINKKDYINRSTTTYDKDVNIKDRKTINDSRNIKNKENLKQGNRKLRAIILVPTRELALQVSKVAKKLAQGTPIQVMPTFGGTNLYEDILRLKRGVDIVVTTLGRILDVLEKRVAPCDACRTLVVDEADKLLSFEFADSLDRIIALVAPARMMLLSATFPASVDVFVRRYLHAPLYINTMAEIALLGVQQFYALVKFKEKLICLKRILERIKFNKCVIFCNSIKNVELLAQRVADMGYAHLYIHSQMVQAERNRVFHSFAEKDARILVSSDLVTRGIDVPAVNCVINFDFPKSAESYVHRIGRSGRFGTHGLAISLICDHETEMVIEIERKLGIEMLPVSDKRFLKYQLKDD